MARGVARSAIRAHGDVLDVMCSGSGTRLCGGRFREIARAVHAIMSSPALNHAVLVMCCGYGEHLSV